MKISKMIKTDCVHFPLDRPCAFHKKSADITCTAPCPHYKSIYRRSKGGARKILIIKLGAMGDVLRTTFLLKGLKEKYPGCRIFWLTKKESVPILDNNPHISEVIVSDDKTPAYLAENFFDEVVNLDLAPESLAFATMSQCLKKTGFYLDGKRRIAASNSYALRWLYMSASDSAKKANRRTYQWWMSKIAGLKKSDYEIYVPLLKDSLKKADAFARRYRIRDKGKIIGLNPGAGSRWQYKKWTTGGYIKLARRLVATGYKVLLYGGQDESSLVGKIKNSVPETISAGTSHNLHDFFAMLNLSDVLITGDTLAMHAALGLRKKVVAIFGPTSASEIEMYGRGIKIITPAACSPCYLPRCLKKPDCMSLVKPAEVERAVIGVLSSVKP